MSFALTIRKRGNSRAGRAPVTSLHKSRPEAVAALAEYVRQNWDEEIGEEKPFTADETVQRPRSTRHKRISIACVFAPLGGGLLFPIHSLFSRPCVWCPVADVTVSEPQWPIPELLNSAAGSCRP